MVIRPARLDDAPALASLCGQLGYPTTEGDVEARLLRLMNTPEHAVLVADVDGRVAAWMHLHARSTLHSEPHVEITGLVVNDVDRSKGIGAAMIASAEHWAAEKGLKEVRLRSNITRTRAHDFYKGLGYQQTKTSLLFSKPASLR